MTTLSIGLNPRWNASPSTRTRLGLLTALVIGSTCAGPAFAAIPVETELKPALPLEQRTFLPKRMAALPNEAPSARLPDVRTDALPAIDLDAFLPQVRTLPDPKVKGAFPRGLHPVIRHAMVEASRFLPDGWQLEFMNALRDAPGVWNGPHGKRDHTGGALAVDVWLVNPRGQRLCNFKCAQNFDDYRRFMEMVKYIQDRDFPAYRKQGRWGGYFAGGYANDEMHYDLEPSDWTMAGNWKQGLLPGYAHFGKRGDTLKGMGDIASYRLPDAGLGTIALAKAPPADLMPPLAVPQKAAVVRPAPVARAGWTKPRVDRRQAQVRQMRRARTVRADYDD